MSRPDSDAVRSLLITARERLAEMPGYLNGYDASTEADQHHAYLVGFADAVRAAESQLTALRQEKTTRKSCLKCEGHGTIRERIDLAGSYNVRHCPCCDGTGKEQIQ